MHLKQRMLASTSSLGQGMGLSQSYLSHYPRLKQNAGRPRWRRSRLKEVPRGEV